MSELLYPIEFSVVIPLYNKEISIHSTIESVLTQTYPTFELIIINDGSTDNSLNVAQSFYDTRIRIINKKNGGVSSARNKGIELSKNPFIVFLDADDFWFPFCLEEFYFLITKYSDAQVFCTSYNMTGKDLQGSNQRYYVKDYFFSSAYYLARWSVPIMLTGCVAVRKYVFSEAGYFNQSITHGEDIDMWRRLSDSYKIAKSERITTIYRTESENRASLKDERQKLSKHEEGTVKGSIKNRSYRLYIGVQLVLELTNINNFRDFKFFLSKVIRCPGRLLCGIIFVIKVRYFNYILRFSIGRGE